MDEAKKEKLIRLAMKEAEIAISEGNSPFGAVLSDKDGNVIVKAHNTANSSMDPTAHAEMNLIRKASKKLGKKDLGDYILISNSESCSMCFVASLKAKITNFVYGTPIKEEHDPNITIHDVVIYSKKEISIDSGTLEKECLEQIRRGRESSR